MPLMDLAYQFEKWKAIGLLVLGRKAAARLVFDTMLQRWPDDAYALASRAHLLTEAGQVQAALSDSRRLVVLRADHAGTWFNHGFMLEAAGELTEAEAAFRRATELGPELDRAWYGLGLVLIRLQRYEEAVSALKKNTELQPMSPYGWYQLARVHVDRHQPDEAAKIIRHLKGFEPKVAAQLERETGLLVGRVS
ncbi:MAG: tetratricopeptide repeat protein [Betaproteobacteria bacterium]|nr:tetratricopeptide repeat protein [Betaproteobacteria bacterium]MBL0297682.1 tetratricopeptide repeat protein [Betaproteobacteria bacterium]